MYFNGFAHCSQNADGAQDMVDKQPGKIAYYPHRNSTTGGKVGSTQNWDVNSLLAGQNRQSSTSTQLGDSASTGNTSTRHQLYKHGQLVIQAATTQATNYTLKARKPSLH